MTAMAGLFFASVSHCSMVPLRNGRLTHKRLHGNNNIRYINYLRDIRRKMT